MSSSSVSEGQRSLIAVNLLAIGLIHTLDLPGKLRETPYLGVAYILLIGATLIAAVGVVTSGHRRWWQLAVATAAIPLIGYVLSRSVGLPAATIDIGNWLEPLGLASLFVEATALLLFVVAAGERSRSERSDAPSPSRWVVRA